MIRIGLAGGIASGKSYVAGLFEEKGCYTVDADEVARSVMIPGGEAYQGVIDAFGQEIVKDDRTIDRDRLRAIVTADTDKLKLLESLTHPTIQRRSEELIKEIARKDSSAIVICNAPLLLESGKLQGYDAIILIWCSRKNQLERLKRRGVPPYDEALKLMATQMPFEEKQKYADYIINNDDTFEETRMEVDRVYALIRLLGRAEKPKNK